MGKEREREKRGECSRAASLIRLHTQREGSEINQTTSRSIHFSTPSAQFIFSSQDKSPLHFKTLHHCYFFHCMYKSRVVMHSAEARELLWVFAAFEIKKSYISRAELVTHLNGFYWINSPLVSTWVSSLELNQQWLSVQYFILSQELGQNVLEFPQQARGKGGAVSKLMESMAADEDFEPNQDSSFSEDENPPVSAQPERPCTPGETLFTFLLVSRAAELFPFIASPFIIAVLWLNQTSFSCPCMQLKVNVFWMTCGRDNFTAYLILIQH